MELFIGIEMIPKRFLKNEEIPNNKKHQELLENKDR